MPLFKNILLLCSTFFFSSCGVFTLLNSGTVSIKYQVSEAEIEGVNYEEVERLTNPSFSIRNVQHPKKHGRWSANFQITPSIHYNDTDFQTGGTFFDDRGMVERPDLNVKRASMLANAKITTHTPAGAFALSLGFGGTMYKLDNGASLETIRTREIRRIDLAWSAFFTKRFFILAGPRYFKADYETYVFAVRLGYFWGKI